MAGSDSGEKTEKATPKRKKDERKKGNVFSSKDMVSAFYILIAFTTIKIFGNFMLANVSESMTFWISSAGNINNITDGDLKTLFTIAAKTVLFTTGPIMFISIAVPIIFTGAQTRFIISFESIKFKFSRLNPLQGLKKLVSIRALVDLLKNLIKLAVIVSIIYNHISDRMNDLAQLFDVDVKSAIIYLCSSVYSAVTTIGIIFVFIGVFDILYQWWEYEKNLKMTKQEIKEEYKQMEGDPQIKGKIKQKQLQMSQQRMMNDVPTADVVIKNPTHFAIAIKYDPEKSIAPIVIAKGMDHVALKIIEIADKNNIAMTENKPLARALYENIEVGQTITEEFYHPVAEVLAFIYEAKQKRLSN